MRRREQGLMPFPFVAAPLTQKDEEARHASMPLCARVPCESTSVARFHDFSHLKWERNELH
eukprot:3789-Amphidinium_carterae.2